MVEFTEGAENAMAVLRDTENRQWYVVPLVVLVFYVYSLEVQAKRWRRVLMGIAFFFGELLIEIVNSLIAQLFGTSPWLCSADTAFMITIGYTIEIAFFFSLCPFILFNFLEGFNSDGAIVFWKFKIKHRFLVVLFLGICSAAVEVCLNRYGLLVWDFWWWNWYFPIFQVLIYTSTLFLAYLAYEKLHDLKVVAIICSIITIITIISFVALVLLEMI